EIEGSLQEIERFVGLMGRHLTEAWTGLGSNVNLNGRSPMGRPARRSAVSRARTSRQSRLQSAPPSRELLMALAVGARLGSYEVLSALGSGGMGEVYRARDPRLGRDVAIKILPPAANADPERLRRFEQEARAAAALNH